MAAGLLTLTQEVLLGNRGSRASSRPSLTGSTPDGSLARNLGGRRSRSSIPDKPAIALEELGMSMAMKAGVTDWEIAAGF